MKQVGESNGSTQAGKKSSEVSDFDLELMQAGLAGQQTVSQQNNQRSLQDILNGRGSQLEGSSDGIGDLDELTQKTGPNSEAAVLGQSSERTAPQAANWNGAVDFSTEDLDDIAEADGAQIDSPRGLPRDSIQPGGSNQTLPRNQLQGNHALNLGSALLAGSSPNTAGRVDLRQLGGLGGGVNLSRGLIKDKPRLIAGQKDLGSRNEDSAAPLLQNLVPHVTQKQDLPQVLMRERSHDQLELVDGIELGSTSPQGYQIQAFAPWTAAPELSSSPTQKTDVMTQVSNQPGSPGELAPEGLSTLGLGILKTSLKGGGEIRVRLRPDHLGELNIRVLAEGNRVGLKIQASDDRAKKIIEDSLGSLRENLSFQNLNLGAVDLSVAKNETHPESRSFQDTGGFQGDFSQSKNHNGSQSGRFLEDSRSSRPGNEVDEWRSGKPLRSPYRAAQNLGRLDVVG
jgi:hypothetical protein